MELSRVKSAWWIEGVPVYYVDGEPFSSCGPYSTKAEATSDLKGLKKFFVSFPEQQEHHAPSRKRKRKKRVHG